ncbi:MAG: hypothetical protein LPK80_06645 [Bacteroidota bacterium]|nr:hypothetical protein [Bacteroidota bacterium]
MASSEGTIMGLFFSSLVFLYPMGAFLAHLPAFAAAYIPSRTFLERMSLSISGMDAWIANINF